MFDNLMESRHVRRPRAGGSVASIALHAAAVAALVAATANARETLGTEQRAERVVFTPPPPPPAPLPPTPASARPTAEPFDQVAI